MLVMTKTIKVIPILDRITTLRCELEKMTEEAASYERLLGHLSRIRTIEMVSPFGIALLTGYIIY